MIRNRKLFFVISLFAFSVFYHACYTVRRIEQRIDRVEARGVKNEEYINKISSDLEKIKKVLADIDARLLSVEEKLTRVSLAKEDVEKIKSDISRLTKKIEFIDSRITFLEKTAIGRGGREGVRRRRENFTGDLGGRRRLTPEEAEKKIQQAKELIVKGKYDEAIDMLNSIFAGGYDSVELRFLIGDAFFRKGDYKLAIRQWISIIDREEELKQNKELSYIIPRTYLRLSHAFLRLGDKKNASLMLRAIVLKYPKSPEAKTAKDLLKNVK